jgi:hypothetical protein
MGEIRREMEARRFLDVAGAKLTGSDRYKLHWCLRLRIPKSALPPYASARAKSILFDPHRPNVRLLLSRFAPIAASYTAAKCGPIR